MSKRRIYFHSILALAVLAVGGVSLYSKGWWLEGKNNVPNFTVIAMVFLLISQIAALVGQRKDRS